MIIIDIENKRVETAATPYSVSQLTYLRHIRRQGFIECPAPSEIAEVAWFTKDEVRKIRVVPESIGQYFTDKNQKNTFIGTFDLSS